MLELRNLTKKYRSGGGTVTALDSVSLCLPDTGLVFVLGKSGSGKSTMLNILGGLDRPTSGELIVNGKSALTSAEMDGYRNSCVGFVFQEYNLLDEFSVGHNVALALRLGGGSGDEKEVVSRVLADVELSGMERRKPFTLSGGQKQRIAIARALVKDPEIILADEPTGALDSETGEQILTLLKKLSARRLVVVVSHDRDFAERYADRIIELKDGKIVNDSLRGASAALSSETHAVAFKRSRLPVGDSVFMGVSSLGRHPFRTLSTVLVCILAFALLGVMITLAMYDPDYTVMSAMRSGTTPCVVLRPQAQIHNDREEGPKTLEEPTYAGVSETAALGAENEATVVGVFDLTNQQAGLFSRGITIYVDDDEQGYLYGSVDMSFNKFYSARPQGFSDCGGEVLEKVSLGHVGEYPERTSEVAISSYMFDVIKKYGLITSDGIKTYENEEDLIGERIPLVSDPERMPTLYLTVTGIYDFGVFPEEYESMRDLDMSDLSTSDDEYQQYIYERVRGMTAYLAESLHQIFYVCDDFYDTYGGILSKSGYDPFSVSFDIDDEVIRNEDGDTMFFTHDTMFAQDVPVYSSETGERLSIDVSEVSTTDIFLSAEHVVGYAGSAISSGIAPIGTEDAVARLSEALASGADIDEPLSDTVRLLESCGALPKTLQTTDFDRYSVRGIADARCVDIDDDIEGAYPVFIYKDVMGTLTGELTKQLSGKTSEYEVPDDARYNWLYMPVTEMTEEAAYRVLDMREFRGDYAYEILNSYYEDAVAISGSIEDFRTIFLVAGIVLAVLGALLMFNLLSVSVSGRAKEIGILRALGARGRNVFAIFFAESLVICLSCFILSSVVAGLVCMLFDGMFVSAFASSLTFSVLDFGVPSVLIIFGISIVVSFAAVFVPVFSVVRKTPVEAIREAV